MGAVLLKGVTKSDLDNGLTSPSRMIVMFVSGYNNATFIVKTYPASPAYMYQEAFSMYPIKRYWRAKVDGTWRGWIEL